MKPRRTRTVTIAEYKGYKIVQTPYMYNDFLKYELITYDCDGDWLCMALSNKSLKHNKLRLMLMRNVKLHERFNGD